VLQSKRKLVRSEIIEIVRRAPGGHELLREKPPPPVRHDNRDQDVERDVYVRDGGGGGGIIGVVQRTAKEYLGT
jgi:hypothetical protein